MILKRYWIVEEDNDDIVNCFSMQLLTNLLNVDGIKLYPSNRIRRQYDGHDNWTS